MQQKIMLTMLAATTIGALALIAAPVASASDVASTSASSYTEVSASTTSYVICNENTAGTGAFGCAEDVGSFTAPELYSYSVSYDSHYTIIEWVDSAGVVADQFNNFGNCIQAVSSGGVQMDPCATTTSENASALASQLWHPTISGTWAQLENVWATDNSGSPECLEGYEGEPVSSHVDLTWTTCTDPSVAGQKWEKVSG
jgi:hypothetical protein